MLALARSAATELGRGLSTALVVRAGSQSCPKCPDCTLVCPEPARIPDCICQAGERQPDPGCPLPPSAFSWLCVFLIGIVLGFFAHWRLSWRAYVEGKPVCIPAPNLAEGECIDREIIAAEARSQLAAVKARARHGVTGR